MMEDLIYRLRKRAEIRRSISTRKSVQNNEPDRIADLLEEAADRIAELEKGIEEYAQQAYKKELTVEEGMERYRAILNRFGVQEVKGEK